jgi:hypothetical protein
MTPLETSAAKRDFSALAFSTESRLRQLCVARFVMPSDVAGVSDMRLRGQVETSQPDLQLVIDSCPCTSCRVVNQTHS